jgi:hypothetical protein
MKGFAEMNLLSPWERGGDGEAIFPQLEWNVQSDPELDNCSKEEVWRYVLLLAKLNNALTNVI